MTATAPPLTAEVVVGVSAVDGSSNKGPADSDFSGDYTVQDHVSSVQVSSRVWGLRCSDVVKVRDSGYGSTRFKIGLHPVQFSGQSGSLVNSAKPDQRRSKIVNKSQRMDPGQTWQGSGQLFTAGQHQDTF